MKICVIEGCSSMHHARGYCRSHYINIIYCKEAANNNVRVCRMGNCNRPHWGKGYCRAHYLQWSRGTLNKLKGFSSWPEYKVYKDMFTRCYNPNCKDYVNYGGRGIKIDPRWHQETNRRDGAGFFRFIEDIGHRPTPKHTIERIDNNGDYEPSNCRWATRAEQQLNTRPYLGVL